MIGQVCALYRILCTSPIMVFIDLVANCNDGTAPPPDGRPSYSCPKVSRSPPSCPQNASAELRFASINESLDAGYREGCQVEFNSTLAWINPPVPVFSEPEWVCYGLVRRGFVENTNGTR